MSSDIRVKLLARLFTHLPQEELEFAVKEMDEAVKARHQGRIKCGQNAPVSAPGGHRDELTS